LLAVDRAAPLLSPAYWRGIDETALRALWRERRVALDQEFEAYLAGVGPVQIDAPIAAGRLTTNEDFHPAS
jgi:hypothetical protein